VLKYLNKGLEINEQQRTEWYHHWVKLGFRAFEQRLANNENTGRCCFGDEPGLADVCLVPQVFNAHRFDVPMDDFPTIVSINKYCLTLPAFDRARPEKQLDFVG